MRRLFFAILATLPLLGVSLAVGRTAPAAGDQPIYYLALGDSLARGHQPSSDQAHGYAVWLNAQLQQKIPGIQLMDLGCSNATSAEFLGQNGQICPNWSDTSEMTSTPQMTLATDFLQHNDVRLITLDIGINDILQYLKSGPNFVNNFIAAIPPTIANVDTILKNIRAVAPTTHLMVMGYYDPVVSQFAMTPTLISTFDNALDTYLNGQLQSEARTYNAQYVDMLPVFNHPAGPTESTAGEIASICYLTWYCSTQPQYAQDVHPTTGGYQVMAEQFWQAGASNP